MTVEEQVKEIVRAMRDKKGVDVKAYDVRGVSGLCDYYVVATGTAAPTGSTVTSSSAASGPYCPLKWLVTRGEQPTMADKNKKRQVVLI